ncbi:MAG: tRNA (adenosine(37)-N6)-threonylcarbamoyltransferase complex ATPase subunit type 1 TsaE [Bacteroidota bacterium]
MQQSIVINSLQELPAAAKELLRLSQGKKSFAFYAPMGTGKTTFIKTICEELGVKATISSPTFSIVNEYLSGKGEKIYHFDFYRIKSIDEAYDLGYEDYFYTKAYCFIEWPERIEELLPEDYVKVTMAVTGEQRILTIEYPEE